MRDQYFADFCHHRNRLEIAQWIEAGIGVQKGIDHEYILACEEQRMAVRRGLGNERGSYVSTGAGSAVDDELLAQGVGDAGED